MRKKILFVIWIIITILIPLAINTYDKKMYTDDVPYISSVVGVELIDININVNKDNSIDVIEAITFNLVEGTPYDGIKVNFPLRDNINGKRRNLKISNISSDDVSIDNKKMFNYNLSHLAKNNDNMASGLYTYTLKYHYDLGDTGDRFIYKIFSNKYNLDILNMTLTINFDENIDQDKVKFISNDNDVTNRITYGVENNVIRASINDFVLDHDIILDVKTNDYFSNTKSTNGIVSVILLIIITLSTIVLLIINIIKHRSVKDVKELYDFDIKCIFGIMFMIVLLSFTYLFIHDLNASFDIAYYIVYGLIALVGLVYLLRLKLK